jgi:hypothetical protein
MSSHCAYEDRSRLGPSELLEGDREASHVSATKTTLPHRAPQYQWIEAIPVGMDHRGAG